MVLLGNIIVAVVASLVTFYLSMRRFRSDKIWEMKVIAYQRIIEALHKNLNYPEGILHHEYEGKEISKEYRKKLEHQASEARKYISLTIRMGSFIISDEASNRLKSYMNKDNEAGESQDLYSIIEEDWKKSNECLNDIIVLAKKDLDQKKFWA